MLALMFILVSFLAGVIILQRLIPDAPPLVRIGGGYIISIYFSGWIAFLTAYGLSATFEGSLLIGFFAAFAVQATVLLAGWRQLKAPSFRLSREWFILLLVSLAFSFWLMESRLSTVAGTVSYNTWGDITFHTSIARSFSWGDGFPPQYAFFGGEPIRYHFGFDFYAGMLERAGLPIAWAFNLPGALGFTTMMVLVFALARFIFRSSAAGWIATTLLITNSSFSFTRYMEKQGYSVIESLRLLWEKKEYSANGPYDGDDIASYWSLNIFNTQTHLIIAVALTLLVTYALIQPICNGQRLSTRHALIFGTIFGLSFWVNGIIYIAAMIFFCALLFFYKRWRELLAFAAMAGIIALPQILWLNGGETSNQGNVKIHFAYLVRDFQPDQLLSYWNVVKYWWLNIGLALPLMILGTILSAPKERKLMFAIMMIFIFGNIVGLGRDIGGNMHKLFNLWEILINLFVAYAIVRIWNAGQRSFRFWDSDIGPATSRFFLRMGVIPLGFILILSGIVDFMTIKNDDHTDYLPHTKLLHWIRDNTPKQAMFLTKPNLIVAAPALAGRRLFLGYESWAEAAGYDAEKRKNISLAIYRATTKEEACRLLQQNKIDYLQLGPDEREDKDLAVNETLFREQFEVVFDQTLQDNQQWLIIKVATSCAAAGHI